MKATYKTTNGRLLFEMVGETAKAIFEELSQIQEIFDVESECGICKSKDIRCCARTVDEFKFYELMCGNCHAQFSFGQKKKGGALFPKRKGDDGHALPNRGWSKYQKPGDAKPTAGATPRKDGVPIYASWDDAERGDCWGDPWLSVGGLLYKMVDGNYQVVKRQETKQ